MRILVPVDGSPASLRAVKFAIEQAKAHAGSDLILLNVQNLAALGLPDGAGIMPPNWIAEEEERAAQEALKPAVAACRDAGIALTARSERGVVVSTIDRVARNERVMQIVMGTRGLGGVRGLLLGSVAVQLLHVTDVPVTLVK
jgi:nucleotide-binding universal stress UspA family protein